MTPEGRIKSQVNRVISRYKNVYKFMPVPGGFGVSSLDYLLCVSGRFVAIETKAPGKKPTDRQKMIIGQITRAGGVAFVIDGAEGLQQLEQYLERTTHAPHPDQPETQSYRRAPPRRRSEPLSECEAGDDVGNPDTDRPSRTD